MADKRAWKKAALDFVAGGGMLEYSYEHLPLAVLCLISERLSPLTCHDFLDIPSKLSRLEHRLRELTKEVRRNKRNKKARV